MMEKKAERRGLARGLSALMADISPSADRDFDSGHRTYLMVPVDKIAPNPNQPRRDFSEAALRDLADSIRQQGIVQPLILRPNGATGMFQIVAGERRWRSAQMAGLHEVPAIIRDLNDADVIEIAIIENIQRADLNAVEEALAYRQLIDRFGHTQEKLAEALSKSRSHVANLLRLLTLPDEVQDLLRRGELTAGHARALITSTQPAQLAKRVIKAGLSVRDTERLAKSEAQSVLRGGAQRRDKAEKDADTLAIEADLSANLKMLVRIDHSGPDDGGTITINYRSLDDLDLICDVLSKIPRDVMATRG